jgi:hypothetical protein
MDVDLSGYDRVIANAVNCELMKLRTSPPAIDLAHEDRLFHTRDLGNDYRFLLLFDGTLGDITSNPHHEAYIFRQFVLDFPAHAYYKNSLRNIHAAQWLFETFSHIHRATLTLCLSGCLALSVFHTYTH